MTSTIRRFDSVEHLRSSVGEELGSGPWTTVDQARIDRFVEATGDRPPALGVPARSGDGSTSAPAFLILSLIPAMGAAIYEVDGLAMAINYGLDSLRFPHVVAVDSRVRTHARLTSAEDAAGGVRVVVRHEVEIDGITEPACVADTVRLLVGGDR